MSEIKYIILYMYLVCYKLEKQKLKIYIHLTYTPDLQVQRKNIHERNVLIENAMTPTP